MMTNETIETRISNGMRAPKRRTKNLSMAAPFGSLASAWARIAVDCAAFRPGPRRGLGLKADDFIYFAANQYPSALM